MIVPGGQEQNAVLSAEEVARIERLSGDPRIYDKELGHHVPRLVRSHEALRVRADQAAEALETISEYSGGEDAEYEMRAVARRALGQEGTQ